MNRNVSTMTFKELNDEWKYLRDYRNDCNLYGKRTAVKSIDRRMRVLEKRTNEIANKLLENA